MKQIILTCFMLVMCPMVHAQEVSPEILAQGEALRQKVMKLDANKATNAKYMRASAYALLGGAGVAMFSMDAGEVVGMPTFGFTPVGEVAVVVALVGYCGMVTTMANGLRLNLMRYQRHRTMVRFFNENGQVVQSPVK